MGRERKRKKRDDVRSQQKTRSTLSLSPILLSRKPQRRKAFRGPTSRGMSLIYSPSCCCCRLRRPIGTERSKKYTMNANESSGNTRPRSALLLLLLQPLFLYAVCAAAVYIYRETRQQADAFRKRGGQPVYRNSRSCFSATYIYTGWGGRSRVRIAP